MDVIICVLQIITVKMVKSYLTPNVMFGVQRILFLKN